jgi:hypothetical protein
VDLVDVFQWLLWMIGRCLTVDSLKTGLNSMTRSNCRARGLVALLLIVLAAAAHALAREYVEPPDGRRQADAHSAEPGSVRAPSAGPVAADDSAVETLRRLDPSLRRDMKPIKQVSMLELSNLTLTDADLAAVGRADMLVSSI